MYTLPETNIAPESQWLEDVFPFGMAYVQRRTVSFRECIYIVPLYHLQSLLKDVLDPATKNHQMYWTLPLKANIL